MLVFKTISSIKAVSLSPIKVISYMIIRSNSTQFTIIKKAICLPPPYKSSGRITLALQCIIFYCNCSLCQTLNSEVVHKTKWIKKEMIRKLTNNAFCYRLFVLDNARLQAGGNADASGFYEGDDTVQWPDSKHFAPVSSTVPKSDVNIAKVGVYFQVHNLSVSRGSKVQKSGYAMFSEGFMSTCSYKSEGSNVFFRAAVFAEMKKDMMYMVECRVSGGEIAYTSCECTAGRGPHVICKHVAVTLYNMEHNERSGEWVLAK